MATSMDSALCYDAVEFSSIKQHFADYLKYLKRRNKDLGDHLAKQAAVSKKTIFTPLFLQKEATKQLGSVFKEPKIASD